MNDFIRKFKAVVIGSSLGGLHALEKIFSVLAVDFPLAVVAVQHLTPDSNLSGLITILGKQCTLPIQEALLNKTILPSHIYIAPPDYHLLIEKDGTFSFDLTERNNYSRPSIDFLFTSAADCFLDALVGVILTGANCDGAKGLKQVRQHGGYAIIEDPRTAHAAEMPRAALEVAGADQVLPLEEIGFFLNKIALSQRS